MEMHGLSPIALFEQTGPISKAIMVILLVASLWSWMLICETLYALHHLNKAFQRIRAGAVEALFHPVFDSGAQEALISVQGENMGERRLRIIGAMNRVASHILHRAESGLPNLAIISSSTPFIGLFGTVWGVMSSFSSIATANDTSLAVVAPGIAEALAATAYGLAAAIPALIGYNRLGASFSWTEQKIYSLIEERGVALSINDGSLEKLSL